MTKLSFGITTSILLLLCTMPACKSIEKEHAEAIKSINAQENTIIFDSLYNDGFDIFYVNDSALVYLNSTVGTPKVLYNKNNTTGLTSVSYDFDYDKLKTGKAVLTMKESPVTDFFEAGETDYTGNSDNSYPNIFKANAPKDLYRVKWPWILIGRTYIANITEPQKLISINFYNATDPELQELPFEQHFTEHTYDEFFIDDAQNSLVLKSWILMPGYDDYRTKELPQVCWSGPAYMSEKYWQLLDSHPNKEELLTFTPEDNSYGFVTITIDSKNNASIDDYIQWRDSYIPIKDGFSANSMQPYYRKREQELQAEFDIKTDKINEAIDQFIKSHTTDFYELHNAYRNNSYKAEQDYPINKEYYAELVLIWISEGENGYYYLIKASAEKKDGIDYNDIYLLTDDNTFRTLDYPQTRIIKGRLARTYLESQHGVCTVLYNAEIVD